MKLGFLNEIFQRKKKKGTSSITFTWHVEINPCQLPHMSQHCAYWGSFRCKLRCISFFIYIFHIHNNVFNHSIVYQKKKCSIMLYHAKGSSMSNYLLSPIPNICNKCYNHGYYHAT